MPDKLTELLDVAARSPRFEPDAERLWRHGRRRTALPAAVAAGVVLIAAVGIGRLVAGPTTVPIVGPVSSVSPSDGVPPPGADLERSDEASQAMADCLERRGLAVERVRLWATADGELTGQMDLELSSSQPAGSTGDPTAWHDDVFQCERDVARLLGHPQQTNTIIPEPTDLPRDE